MENSGLEFDITVEQPGFRLHAEAKCKAPSTGLFGATGSGKSTLLLALAGLVRPSRGFIRHDGRTLFDSQARIHIPPHQRAIGMVFQDSRLFPHLSVESNLRFGQKRQSPSRRRFSFDKTVDLLELAPLLPRRAAALSGGERQLVALGRALLSSPNLLLLDEPLASLDRGLRLRLLPVLRRLHEHYDLPTLHVSHDLSEILHLTSETILISQGRTVASGPFLEIVRNPGVLDLLHDLGLLNLLELHVESVSAEEGVSMLAPAPEIRRSRSWRIAGPLLEEASPGRTVQAVLRAEDIGLMLAPVHGISFQNQIPGRLERIVLSERRAVCLVDAGLPLLCEVTPRAVRQLRLNEGQAVWLMFKAQALRYLG